MKVGLLGPENRLLVEERPEPVAGPGEVVVRMAACGVCGTDLEKWRGNYRTAGKIGHEPAGSVAAVGPGVTGLEVGARVAVHHHVPCYTCEVCRRGDLTFCPSYSKTNIDPGGFAEKFRVPEENVRRGAVLPIDASVSFEAASLLEPAGCALTALRRVGFKAGDRVFVVGLGPVGILYARLAKALGAAFVGGAELSAKRREAAERGGLDLVAEPRDPDALVEAVRRASHGAGVDLSVVATGAPAAVKLASRLARRGGALNLFGLPEPGSRLDWDLQELYLSGVRVVPTYATTEEDLRSVHDLLVAGSLKVDDLVTHRVPLERLEEAFRIARSPDESVKVVVTGAA